MKSTKLVWLVILVIVTLVLSSCGGNDTPTTAPAAGATNTTGAAAGAPTDTVAPAAGATNTTGAAAGATNTTAAAAPTNTTAAAAGGAATATAPPPTPVSLGDPSKAKTTITIWHSWASDYLAPKAAIFADYVAQHPDVAIKLLSVPDLNTKVQNAVPAGVGPDIIAWVDDQIGTNVLVGAIDPLDGKGGITQDYLKSLYPDVAVNAVTFNNQIYALPETLEAITFIYNKDLISEDQIPKNTTDLVAKMKDYNSKNPGKYFVVWDPNNAYTNAPWLYGAGGQYVDAQGTAHLDSPQALATAQFIRSLQGTMPKDIDGNAADALFNDGKAAIELTGPWRVNGLQKQGMKFGLAKIPMVDFGDKGPARPFVGVKNLMLAHGSKNPDVAVDVMKFYTNADNLQKMAKQTGEVPAAKAAAQALSSDPVVQGFNAQAVDGVPLPNTPYMGALWDPAAKAWTALWTGTDDPKAIMTAAQAAATAALAKMK
jgi:arabinogalactan oligomer/maltooligosaccharide transport system substrate-binding protein